MAAQEGSEALLQAAALAPRAARPSGVRGPPHLARSLAGPDSARPGPRARGGRGAPGIRPRAAAPSPRRAGSVAARSKIVRGTVVTGIPSSTVTLVGRQRRVVAADLLRRAAPVRDGDVDARPRVRPDHPERRRRPVAEDGVGAGGEHGRHPPSLSRASADGPRRRRRRGGDAAAPCAMPVLDRVLRSSPSSSELPPPHDPVLAPPRASASSAVVSRVRTKPSHDDGAFADSAGMPASVAGRAHVWRAVCVGSLATGVCVTVPLLRVALRVTPERLASYHAYTRKHSVNWPMYRVARAFLLPFFLVYFRLERRGREYGRVEGRGDRRRQPPQLPRPLRRRRLPALAAADELHGQGRALRAALAGLDALPARRLPGPPRRVRRGLDADRADDRRTRRRRLPLPRGHPDPPRHPRRPQARRRPARPADRRGGDPDRGARHRTRPPRLAHPPAQGEGADGAADDLPARRGALAGAGRNGDRRGSGPTSCCSGKTSAACRRCAAPR